LCYEISRVARTICVHYLKEVLPMTPEIPTPVNVDEMIDIAFHHEIKCRAYELYERRHSADSPDLKGELPRVAYAIAQIQKNANGEAADNRAVRAARIYLRALTSIISERDMD
jgi:hypothetical protein